MNPLTDKLQSEAIKLIDGLKEIAPDAIAAASRAIFIHGAVTLAGGLVFWVISGSIAICLKRWWNKGELDLDEDERRLIFTIVGGLSAVVLFAVGCGLIFDPKTWMAVFDQKAYMAWKVINR